jgi:hypothetical protein
VAEVPDIAIAAVNIFLGLLDGNIVRLRVGDGFFARDDVPFAPGGDDLQFRRQGFGGQLEANLIVALSRAAVRDSIGAQLFGELHLALRQKRTREGCAEQDICVRTPLQRAAWARCNR